jgi:hypothetical protein
MHVMVLQQKCITNFGIRNDNSLYGNSNMMDGTKKTIDPRRLFVSMTALSALFLALSTVLRPKQAYVGNERRVLSAAEVSSLNNNSASDASAKVSRTHWQAPNGLNDLMTFIDPGTFK